MQTQRTLPHWLNGGDNLWRRPSDDTCVVAPSLACDTLQLSTVKVVVEFATDARASLIDQWRFLLLVVLMVNVQVALEIRSFGDAR